MNIQELINKGIKQLNECEVEDSGLKARALLQYILKKDKKYLVINSKEEVSKAYEETYEKCIQQLLQGKPLQYITNKAEFMGLEFYVDENVLIPQPDTEVLVEETIKVIEDKINERNRSLENITIRILDMCTGSGAIAISLAKYLQGLQGIGFEIYALDISDKALSIAKRNAYDNNVQVSFIKSDMFKELKGQDVEKFDIIVSNPPYIETEIISQLTKEVQSEPYLALDGGKDGLDFYRNIAKNGYKYLQAERVYTSRDRL